VNNPEPAAQICAHFATSLAHGTFARLVLSTPVAPGDAPQKILGRFIMLQGVPHLSLTLRHATRDVTRNLPVAAGPAWLREQLGSQFRSALLSTTQCDWQFISTAAGAARLIAHHPSAKTTPSREHDQKRVGVLDASARDWLEGLGVLDREGKLRASMADKHRQINHYLEILSHLAKECGWSAYPEGRVSRIPDSPVGFGAGNWSRGKDAPLVLADMGCGKGYLTFGTWHLFHRVGKHPVRVIGVETREDLVSTTNRLATQLPAEGLEFVRGTIASVKLPPVDALIALHACNTATDDAIRRGIELGAKLIIVAPCCHQELRPQLGQPEPFASVLRHGLMAERLAEWVTDGLRAQFLEWAGYRTKMLEFVAGEHTPKNLMIAAVREREPFADAVVQARIVELKQFFGIERHALDALLAPPQRAA